MKKYDVFHSQCGYAVALGIYLDSPVMGSCMWFPTKEQALDFSRKKRAYDNALAEYNEKLREAFDYGIEEIEKLPVPQEEDFGIVPGVWI